MKRENEIESTVNDLDTSRLVPLFESCLFLSLYCYCRRKYCIFQDLYYEKQ